MHHANVVWYVCLSNIQTHLIIISFFFFEGSYHIFYFISFHFQKNTTIISYILLFLFLVLVVFNY